MGMNKQKFGLWLIRLGEKLCVKKHPDGLEEGVVSTYGESYKEAVAPPMPKEKDLKQCNKIWPNHNFGPWEQKPGFERDGYSSKKHDIMVQVRKCKDCNYRDISR